MSDLRIYERAAKKQKGQIWLKRVIAEMGGKDTVVVDKEADLATQSIVASAFGFSRQKCSACSRAVVLRGVRRGSPSAANLAKTWKVGDPARFETKMGPVMVLSSFQKIMRYIEIGKTEGNIIIGGTGDDSIGYYIEPTIIADVEPDARIMQEEIFAPVVCVCIGEKF